MRRSVGPQLRDCSGANDLIGPPSDLSTCRAHSPPAFARVLYTAVSATPDNTRPLPHPTTGVVVELEGAVGKPKVPLRVPHRDQFYFLRTETCPHHRRQDGRAAPFASNKLGATASSNATRRRAQSCVSSYLRGCRFGFVGRGTDEHSQGEVGGAGSYNGATRATKPSYDVRSVRLRLGFCKYGLACAGICVLVHSRRSGAGAHVLRGPLWRCGSSRSYPCGFGRQRGGLEPATPSEVLRESRTSSWPAAFEGSHGAATARVERAAAARVSN